MKRRLAPRKSVPNFVMFSTIIIAVSIPLIVLGLNGETTFDIRNRAYETESPTSTNPCVIYLPKVNPETLEKDGTYKVSAEAISDVKDIEGIILIDENSNTLFEKEYISLTDSVAETFTYTPSETGTDFIRGTLQKVGEDIACSGVSITVIEENKKPTVTSSKDNFNLVAGDEYEYTIIAEDPDGDVVNYFYSFTPDADWLQNVIVKDGTDGTVKISLQGTPTEPASYLLHIFAHDGYNNHLESIAWVINVSQGENDTPIITILNPTEDISINEGETILSKWLASDLNQIVKYELYIASDPSNTDTWTTIDDNISYKITDYQINSSGLSTGTYQLIVRATDNQDPAKTGIAVSPTITIFGETEEEEISDDIVLTEPQIINVTPNNSAEVENLQPIIRATLIAGSGAIIEEDSISLSINDKEVTEGIRLNKISDSEITLIYQSPENMVRGIQKIHISFSDSNEDSIEKSWTFTIVDKTTEDDTDTFSIFGIKIGKKTALIIGAGLIVMILAILIPILIYKVWSKDNEEGATQNKNLPPKIPSTKKMFDIDQRVNTTPTEELETTIQENTKQESSIEQFKALSSKELSQEAKKEVQIPENNISAEQKETSTSLEAEETKWKPKQPAPESTEPLTEESAIPETSLPNLDIPSPETFTQQNQSQDSPSSEKTMDEITQLYKEIQKVENSGQEQPSQKEDTQNKNS